MSEVPITETSFQDQLGPFAEGKVPIIYCKTWEETEQALACFKAKPQAADGFEKANNQTVLCRPTSLDNIKLEEITDLDTDTKSWRVYNTAELDNDNKK